MTEPVAFPGILGAIREQTAHLLGTTISYDAEDWARPTPLPGWSRAHVAAHLVDQALRCIDALEDAAPPAARPNADEQRAIEVRALDAGLDLQIELDETAGRLQEVLTRHDEDRHPVELAPGWSLPAEEVAVVRLRELVVHHHDLIGSEALDLPPEVVRAVVQFEVERPRLEGLPPVLLVSDEGFSARVGPEEEAATTVVGPERDLLLYLARGIVAPTISGTLSPPQ